jgi:hypothetical protein
MLVHLNRSGVERHRFAKRVVLRSNFWATVALFGQEYWRIQRRRWNQTKPGPKSIVAQAACVEG